MPTLSMSEELEIELIIMFSRLLDLLSQEPRWGEGDCCEECMVSCLYRYREIN